MRRGAFDRMMIEVELEANPKIGRLDNAQYRCLISGVWALAAKATPRGYLVAAGEPIAPEDVARQARCSVTVARKTLAALRQMDMIEMDDELGVEFVHDWWEMNPDPKKPDPTGAERQRRWRERMKARNGSRNALRNGASDAA